MKKYLKLTIIILILTIILPSKSFAMENKAIELGSNNIILLNGKVILTKDILKHFNKNYNLDSKDGMRKSIDSLILQTEKKSEKKLNKMIYIL